MHEMNLSLNSGKSKGLMEPKIHQDDVEQFDSLE